MKEVRKVNFLIYVLLIISIFSSCSRNCKTDITEQFKHFKGYEAIVSLHFLKDNQENVLKLKQTVNGDGSYTLTFIEPEHLKDMIVSCDGEKITQYHPNTKQTVVSTHLYAQNVTLLTGMIESYYKKELKQKEEMLDGKRTVCFIRMLPRGYKYLSEQRLWVDTDSQKPIKLVVYGETHQITMEITYETFKYY